MKMEIIFEDGTKKRVKATDAYTLLIRKAGGWRDGHKAGHKPRKKEVRLYTNPYNSGVGHILFIEKGTDNVEGWWIEHLGSYGLSILQGEADVYENGRFW
jgi:hypothetical protein